MKVPVRVNIGEFSVFVLLPERTHPDDWVAAVQKRLKGGKTENDVLEHMMIDSLVESDQEGRGWSNEQRLWLAKRADKRFIQRLSKALSTKRKPTFSPLEEAILQNWREVVISDSTKTNKHILPGLRHWRSKAALTFLQETGSAFRLPKSTGTPYYDRLLFSLGLARADAQIRDFVFDKKKMQLAIYQE